MARKRTPESEAKAVVSDPGKMSPPEEKDPKKTQLPYPPGTTRVDN